MRAKISTATAHAVGYARVMSPQAKVTAKKATTTKAAKPSAKAVKPGKLAGPLAKLIARAKAKDVYAAGEAMEKILALGAKAAPAREELRAFVSDKEPRRSLGARAVLAVLGDDRPAHLDAILLAAATGKGDAKAVARVTLRELPGPVVAEAIGRGVQASKPAVRELTAMMSGSTVPIRESVSLETLLPLLDDSDERVRAMAIQSIQQHVAPLAPAKPTAKLTPAIHARVAKLCGDESKSVAARAKQFVDELRG